MRIYSHRKSGLGDGIAPVTYRVDYSAFCANSAQLPGTFFVKLEYFRL
jgi:hypothetical protein